ncbi:hypothetical protein GGX14DRAFT_569515 [Mycena pura]|uniref:Autophagy-related protein n=1 Tax=Mycena pura TaxID=153505 RepID=A0AAD6V6K0_9AGAR|nr:hypothetical protein GGX14DRAFT_569515 [Mycena pura]
MLRGSRPDHGTMGSLLAATGGWIDTAGFSLYVALTVIAMGGIADHRAHLLYLSDLLPRDCSLGYRGTALLAPHRKIQLLTFALLGWYGYSQHSSHALRPGAPLITHTSPAERSALRHINSHAQLRAYDIAMGYGAGICLLVAPIPVSKLGGFTWSLRLAIGLTEGAAWPDHSTTAKSGVAWREIDAAWKRLGGMLHPREIKRLRNTFKYLAAWFFLSDRFTAVLFCKTTLHMRPSSLILISMLTPLSGILGSLDASASLRVVEPSNLNPALRIPYYAVLSVLQSIQLDHLEVTVINKLQRTNGQAEESDKPVFDGSMGHGHSISPDSELLPMSQTQDKVSYPCAPCILRGESDACRDVDKSYDNSSKATAETIEDLLHRVSALETTVLKLSDASSASLESNRDEPSHLPSPRGSPPVTLTRQSPVCSALDAKATDEDAAMMLEDFAMGNRVNQTRATEDLEAAPYSTIGRSQRLAIPPHGSSVHLGVPDGHPLALLIDPSTNIMSRLLVSILPQAQTDPLIQFYFDRLDWYSKVQPLSTETLRALSLHSLNLTVISICYSQGPAQAIVYRRSKQPSADA